MYSYNCPNKKLVKQLERLLLALEFLFMNEFWGYYLDEQKFDWHCLHGFVPTPSNPMY